MAVLSVANRRIMSLAFVSILLFFCTSVFSAPVADPAPRPVGCYNPLVRREWRTLSKLEKQDYLRAVNCFLTKPGITPRSLVPGLKSRYDDLVATHINQTFSIHYVGHFLPWHRYYTAYFETALIKECGYKGAQPYWDWHKDVAQGDQKFFNSPIFDDLGFGGNGDFLPVPPEQAGFAVPGRTGGGCVKNGAFKDMEVNLGPGNSFSGNPRCLSRDFSPYFSGRYLAANQTKITLQANDFYDFDKIVEGGPSFEASGVHGGGHYGIGGTLGIMGDLYVSPGDPAFWLHHANLDRVWWSWQKLKLPTRLTDFGGPSCILDYYTPGKNPPQACANVTLSQPMNLGFNHQGLTVADVMDIKGDYLCYTYDELLDPTKL